MSDTKILDLPLKKEWYDLQYNGEKTEEYREITPYWCNRLLGGRPYGINQYWKPVLERILNAGRMPDVHNLNYLLIWQYGTRGYTHVRFRYGYTKRTFLSKIVNISIGYGKPEWCAPSDREVFIIKHNKNDV